MELSQALVEPGLHQVLERAYRHADDDLPDAEFADALDRKSERSRALDEAELVDIDLAVGAIAIGFPLCRSQRHSGSGLPRGRTDRDTPRSGACGTAPR